MSKYTEFIKANFNKVQGATAKDKMKKLAQMWKQQKGSGFMSVDESGSECECDGGRSIAGRSVGGKRVGGMRKVPITRGPESVAPQYRPSKQMIKLANTGGFLQFLPMIMSLFGSGKLYAGKSIRG